MIFDPCSSSPFPLESVAQGKTVLVMVGMPAGPTLTSRGALQPISCYSRLLTTQAKACLPHLLCPGCPYSSLSSSNCGKFAFKPVTNSMFLIFSLNIAIGPLGHCWRLLQVLPNLFFLSSRLYLTQYQRTFKNKTDQFFPSQKTMLSPSGPSFHPLLL